MRAAALAYFIILPLPSLLLITLMILSQIYGQTDAFQAFIQQITIVVGPAVANMIQQILETVTTPFTSILASITTIVFTVMGAIGAFGVLQDTMNNLWDIFPKKLSFIQRLRRRIIPFLLVSAFGFGIMVWTGFTTVLLDFIIVTLVPLATDTVSIFFKIAQNVLSFVLSTLFFAFIYKLIPELPLSWKDVRLAAIFTGLVFTLTNNLIGLIIETFTVTSVTGAAGAVIVLLLWIYSITLLIIYGAAFSKSYTEKINSYSVNKQKFKQNGK